MVYSNTVEKYNENYNTLKRNYAEYSNFLDYIKDNWANCVEMWVQCYREKQYNLRETTNNRIESLNCHLKELGHYTDTLVECYKSVMTSISYFEQQKSLKKFKEQLKVPLFKRSEIPEVNKYEDIINKSVTQKIADYVVDQMNMAFELEIQIHQINENKYRITCPGHRNVETEIYSCNCYRYTNTNLPCFYIFRLRHHLKIPLFEQYMTPQQYDKEIYIETPKVSMPFAKLNVKGFGKYTPSSSSKFLSAKVHTDKLAEIMSRAGTKTYNKQMSVVRDLSEFFAEKKSVKILPSTSTSSTSSDSEIIEEIEKVLPPELEIEESVKPKLINIKPQVREKFAGRPGGKLTAIRKPRERDKPSLRIRKGKHLEISPKSPSGHGTPTKRPKIDIIEIEVSINIFKITSN